MSATTRRSFETGHRPKFLVVIDETPECDRALRFGARRAARTGAGLVLLGIVDPPDSFEWLGVGDTMRAEAEAAIARQIEAAATRARHAAGIEAERVIRTGERAAEILALIEADPDISFLVLAAASGKDGPGPPVGGIAASASASFPVPIVIVPGGLADEAIDALAG